MRTYSKRIYNGIPRFLLQDIKQLLRTPGLLFFMTIPVLMWSGLRIVIPLINSLCIEYIDINIIDYSAYAYSFLLLVPGMMGGMIIALMLVDDRDLGLIRYYGVLPFGKTGYLAGRTVIMFILSWVLTIVFIVLPGFHEFNSIQLILLPPLSAMGAPFIAYIGAGLSKNKVTAMAVLKTLTGLYVIPMIQFVLPDLLDPLLGIFPPYWVTRIFFITGAANINIVDLLISITACLISHAVFLWLALRFFTRKEN